ncbi:hypothetical protein ACHWQZ_G007294 [Mnemiopsis leidyi]
MRHLAYCLVLLVPAFITLILYIKQDGERLCSELRDLEQEMGDSRQAVLTHLQEIRSIKPKLDTEILVLIITAPNNREFRDQLRRESYLTYPWSYTAKDDFDVQYAFVCGYSTNRTLLAEMRREAVETGDLLIGDFEDTYENLVYKTIWLLRYAVERYTFDYVFKVDDDTFINSELLYDFLYKYIKPKYNDINVGYYGGMIRHGSREVQREGQWGIQKWEFEPDILPPYHVGGAYILSHLAATQLIDLNAKQTMVAFRIEDAYVGALADRIGLTPRDIPHTYSKQYDRFCDDKLGKIYHRVAPSWQAKMIHNWTTLGYYCKEAKSLEKIIEDGEEMIRKY